MKKLTALLALLIIATLAFTACAPAAEPAAEAPAEEEAMEEKEEEAPAAEEEAPAAELQPVKACMVTDSAGIGDKSFNDGVWKGLEQAMAEFDTVEANYIESKTADDYAPNIQACLDSEPDVVLCVGFLMADDCEAAIKANPDVYFAGVDIGYAEAYPNFLGVDAKMDQSCFQAGYLAAGMSETGTVGTYTGYFGEVVHIFMDGFWMGVDYYNKAKGTDVKVLGYDPADPEWKNVTATNDWVDVDKGRQVSESLMDNNADIILPVIGQVGTGTAAVMEERGYGYIFGVDQDWLETNPAQKDQILASVLKNMHVPIYEMAKNLTQTGTWIGGTYFVLEYANGGTGIVFNPDVDIPEDLKAEVLAIEDEILAGTLTTLSPEFLAEYPNRK
jgi:basic membrane protein A